MDRQVLEREILLSGYEDSTGLWEVMWFANTLSPELPEKEKIAVVRSLLGGLIRDGVISLLRREPGTRHEKKLSKAEACEVLESDDNWATPDVVGAEFRFMNTKKGDLALHKIWMEASS